MDSGTKCCAVEHTGNCGEGPQNGPMIMIGFVGPILKANALKGSPPLLVEGANGIAVLFAAGTALTLVTVVMGAVINNVFCAAHAPNSVTENRI